MKKIQKLIVLSATLFGAWMLFGSANTAQAAVSVIKPACAYEANNYAITVNWTEGAGTLGSYIVDISTSPNFDYVWNKNVAAGNFSVADAPNGFVDSPWDSGVNPTPTIGFVPGTTYYVRLYNGAHYPNLTPGLSFSVPECAPPTQPTVSGLPSCAISANGYSGTINWTGGANPAYGYYVDISDNAFGRWWTKNVNVGTSTAFPAGFNGYSGVAGPLGNLSPGVVYSIRVFNGEHSAINTFSVPLCTQPTCTNTSPNNFTVPYGTNSHTMFITTANATAVHFAVMPPATGATWYPGAQTIPGFFSVTIDLSVFPQYGNFTVDVYMDNANYFGSNTQGCQFHPNFTRQAPIAATCTGAGPDGFVTYNEWGNHTIDVTGVHPSATAVNIAVFRNGVDPFWYLSSAGAVQNLGGGNWRLVFDMGSHIPSNYSGGINVHVYMNNPVQNNTFCDTANFVKSLRPATTAPSVVPSTNLPCTNNPYTVTLSWVGDPRPAGGPIYSGYYVDAAVVADFSSLWNKVVPVGTMSTVAGAGFNPYIGVNGALVLNPGTTYYFRVFNDSHSPTTSFSIPRCGSLEITANQAGGAWTLNGPNGFTKNGTGPKTGAEAFSPANCLVDSYYCIPVGTYTLTPAVNSPPGYNGVVNPPSHIVN